VAKATTRILCAYTSGSSKNLRDSSGKTCGVPACFLIKIVVPHIPPKALAGEAGALLSDQTASCSCHASARVQLGWRYPAKANRSIEAEIGLLHCAFFTRNPDANPRSSNGAILARGTEQLLQ